MRPNIHSLAQLMVLAVMALLVVGCVAPGSNVTAIRFSGEVRDATGHPISYLPIQICLPGAYGLAGLDAALGKPQDYAHLDQWVSLMTDYDGRFTYQFKPVTYSQQFWLFPPLGVSPKNPPKPVVGMRTTVGVDQWFIVYVEGDHTRALLFRKQPPERTALANNVGRPTLRLRPAAPDYPRGWDVNISAVRP